MEAKKLDFSRETVRVMDAINRKDRFMPDKRVKTVGDSTYTIVKRTALDGKMWWVLLERYHWHDYIAPSTYYLGKYKTLKDAKYTMERCDKENAMLRGRYDW